MMKLIVCGAILALVLTTCASPSPSGCTVFTVSKGDQVFFGGNDDYITPDSYYWVDPGDAQSAGADGELVFTHKPRGDGFLVSTNFNVANPANSFSYPCWRYDTARERLAGLLDQGDGVAAGVLLQQGLPR
jgi:hypothetical protein